MIFGHDLKRKRLALPECGPAIQSHAGQTQDREMHGQHVARLAHRVIARRKVNGSHRTVGKNSGVKSRCNFRIAVKPQANRSLGKGHGMSSPWWRRRRDTQYGLTIKAVYHCNQPAPCLSTLPDLWSLVVAWPCDIARASLGNNPPLSLRRAVRANLSLWLIYFVNY